jgi:hypothetical protein
MEDKLVRLRNYDRMEEALLDENILRQNEIECSVFNSTSAEILPMLYEINEGIALMVFEKDFDHAWEVLKEYHQLDAD